MEIIRFAISLFLLSNYTCIGAERRARLLRIAQCRATNEPFQRNQPLPPPLRENKRGADRGLKNEKKKKNEKSKDRKREREEMVRAVHEPRSSIKPFEGL